MQVIQVYTLFSNHPLFLPLRLQIQLSSQVFNYSLLRNIQVNSMNYTWQISSFELDWECIYLHSHYLHNIHTKRFCQRTHFTNYTAHLCVSTQEKQKVYIVCKEILPSQLINSMASSSTSLNIDTDNSLRNKNLSRRNNKHVNL